MHRSGSARVRRDFLVFVSPPARTDRHTIMCGRIGGVRCRVAVEVDMAPRSVRVLSVRALSASHRSTSSAESSVFAHEQVDVLRNCHSGNQARTTLGHQLQPASADLLVDHRAAQR